MKHQNSVFDVIVNVEAEDFVARVIQNSTAALQRFNELQFQIEQFSIINATSFSFSFESFASFSITIFLNFETLIMIAQIVTQILVHQFSSSVVTTSQNVVALFIRLFEKLFDVVEYDKNKDK